jgi:hypothetical protein
MRFDSRRADCQGYLEFIWRSDIPREPDTNPQAIAYITDAYSTPRKPWFCGVYGIHVVEGPSVSTVKSELFSLIEAGQ